MTIKLLKNSRNSNNVEQQLDFWDYSLCDLMAELIIHRYRYVRILDDVAADIIKAYGGGA